MKKSYVTGQIKNAYLVRLSDKPDPHWRGKRRSTLYFIGANNLAAAKRAALACHPRAAYVAHAENVTP